MELFLHLQNTDYVKFLRGNPEMSDHIKIPEKLISEIKELLKRVPHEGIIGTGYHQVNCAGCKALSLLGKLEEHVS